MHVYFLNAATPSSNTAVGSVSYWLITGVTFARVRLATKGMF